MAAKCPKCGAFVSKKGELCTLCKYQSMGSQGGQNTIEGTSGTEQGIHTDNSVHQTEVSENNQLAFKKNFTDGKMIEGVVQNYMVSPSSDGVISRWMKSFITGVPFTMDPNRISFNVIDTESLRKMGTTGVNSAHVQIYGVISAGDICNGQTVKVWGKKDSNNVWYASRIQNTLTSVITTFDKCIPAWVIRIITILVLLLPVLLVLTLGGGTPQEAVSAGGAVFTPGAGVQDGAAAMSGAQRSGLLQSLTHGLVFVGKIAVLLVAGIFGYKVFKALKLPLNVWYISLLVLFCLLFPALGIQIGAIVLMVYVMIKLVTMLFK